MSESRNKAALLLGAALVVTLLMALWAHVSHTGKGAHPEADQRLNRIERLLDLSPSERQAEQ